MVRELAQRRGSNLRRQKGDKSRNGKKATLVALYTTRWK